MRCKFGLWLLPWIVFGSSAFAVTPVFDINVFYFTDTFTYNSAPSVYKRTFYDFMAGFGITKKRSFVLGWNYDSMSFSDNPGTATTLAVTDMGPKFMYYIDKDRTWVVALTYNLITKGTYNPGTTPTELRGSSMRFEAGYLPQMTDNICMGAKLNYYKASFTEEISNQTALAKVTDSRTVIYPSFSMTIRFE